MKAMLIFGTRPEAIKMCPIIIEMKKHSEIDCVTCLTGQHKEMLQQVMDVFDVQEDYNLNIMRDRQTLSEISARVIQGIDELIKKEKPDIVLVHGDTTTSFAAALAAFYNNVYIGHVEAGLRTYNMYSPFPEEFNRQSVDLISNFMFAPTGQACNQLINEGKDEANIYVTGNTVIDALNTTIKDDFLDDCLESVQNKKMILMTIHRRENLGQPMINIFTAVKKVVEKYNDIVVVYPIHKNPAVREIANSVFGDNDRIKLIEPMGPLEFHNYMKKSYMILTDSGGIQEEAPALGKPVLVARETTERPEGVKAGVLRLVGTEEESVFDNMCKLIENEDEYNKMSVAINPYGDGRASERIVNILLDVLEKKK